MPDTTPRHFLLVTQVYLPDPTAVGQYMAEAGEALVGRGCRVTVFTANRGYDDPSREFPLRETLGGVDVQRLPLSSFGKASILHRLAAQLSFCLQAIVRGVFMRRLDAVLVTTSPPMGSAVGWVISLMRGVPLHFWVMDINPGQAVALGHFKASSPLVKVFNWFNRRVLHRAATVTVLDRFMGETVAAMLPTARPRIRVIPPWPMERVLERLEHAVNPFRTEHGLEGKVVFAYSGNHSIAHPLETFVEAARQLRDDDRVVFLFIGGGKAKAAIDEIIAREQPPNLRSLPYQPLERIKYSLSAADVHLVSMGEAMIGYVHPCKFYASLVLGRPFLFAGPAACHIGEVLRDYQCGWRVDHGDVAGALAAIRAVAAMSDEARDAVGARGQQALAEAFAATRLCADFCDLLQGEPVAGAALPPTAVEKL